MFPDSSSRRAVLTHRSWLSWLKRSFLVAFLFVFFSTIIRDQVFAQAAPTTEFKYIGVNMHGLQRHDENTLNSVFGYLSKCGVNTVRTFGLAERGGVDSINRIANVAGRNGIQLVVALADFANGSAQMSGANQDPTAYFSGGYASQGYSSYVQQAANSLANNSNIAVVELANEPHCVGRADCLDPFVNWVGQMGSILNGKGFGVSVGTMVNRLGYSDEPGVGFSRINSQTGITQASGHFYPETEPEKRELLVAAAREAESLGKEMMMGEIGFRCNTEPCTNSSNDQERAEKIQEEMQFFGENGYDGFLYWQFSGFKSNPLENDGFSWFADGPDDVDNPICKVLREGSIGPAQPKLPPTFIYPRNLEETEKYLANSQVYCANRFGLKTQFKGEAPPLLNCREADDLGAGLPADAEKIQIGDQICTPYEYPINDETEVTTFGSESGGSSFSFPLFRDQAGGISIESDLSEISPNDTWFEALKRQSRPKAAPQFYLTSPVTQCLNLVHQMKYVQQACTEFSDKPVSECAANMNINISLPEGGGSSKRLLDFASLFPDESVCNNIGDDIEKNTLRAQALRSISPSTPKLFKMAYIVQHTHLHHDNTFQDLFYMLQQLASWFGTIPPTSNPNYGEKLDIVPIWYHAGIAVDKFDEYINPETGVFRPYAFDPTTLNGKDLAVDRPVQSNFIGPWTNTYEALMAPQFQEAIAEKRMRTVYENWQLMQQAKYQWTDTVLNLSVDNVQVAQDALAPIECSGVRGGAPGDACLCFKEDGGNCPNQSYSEIFQAYPEGFQVQDPSSYAKALKIMLVSRIKSGIQRSNRFAEGLPNEDLSRRVWDKCFVSPEGDGVQEVSTSIGSSALQNEKNPIKAITNAMRSKLVNDPNIPDEDQVMRQQTQMFVVLPDEALTIEVAQAYVAPMFLSPEMYSNIMTGKTDLLPLAELSDTQQRQPFYSAFLRAFGINKSLQGEPEGYVKVNPVFYNYQPSCTTPNCGCSPINVQETGRGEAEWMPLDEYEDLLEEQLNPSCDNLTITKYEKIVDSTQEVKYHNEEKNLNPNPEVPGQFAAFAEFLRRLAFTPAHMHSYITYPGLEEFYRGNGQQDINGAAGQNEAGQDIPRACVYANPQTITPSESGYNTLEDLRRPVCSAAQQTGLPAHLLRALLEVEGSPLLRAVRNKSSYVCKPNSAGAVGPMGVLVTQCTTRDYGFQTQYNTLNPNWCTPEGAILGGAIIAREKLAVARSQNQSLNVDSPAGYLAVAEGYLGIGSCGDLNNDTDGQAKPLAGSSLDYCAYVRNMAEHFKSLNMCAGN